MTENAQPRKKWEEADSEGRVVDKRQFPELNAFFYSADPSEFIKLRSQVLSMMAIDDAFLAPAFAVDREIGSMRFSGGGVPPVDARMRYMRTEAVNIVHHASETLLRLYFAHIDHPECPWLGMSAPVPFWDFKERVSKALDDGFDADHIARLFLGGASPSDAGVDVTEEEFDASIEAYRFLLGVCGDRFVGDAFLYNAVKHGLTAIDLDDEEARMEWVSHEGERVPMHKGPAHIYLHEKLTPNAKPDEGTWFMSVEDPNIDRDLAVTSMIAYAMDSLWSVARRDHLGAEGQIFCMKVGSIEMSIYGPIQRAANIMQRMASELAKVKPDGEVDGTNHHFSIYHIPDDWDPSTEEHAPYIRGVKLPLRSQDVRQPTNRSSAYMPFGPRGFQQGPS